MIKAIADLNKFFDKHNFGTSDKPTITLRFNDSNSAYKFSAAIRSENPYAHELDVSPMLCGRICGLEIETVIKDRRKADRRKS